MLSGQDTKRQEPKRRISGAFAASLDAFGGCWMLYGIFCSVFSLSPHFFFLSPYLYSFSVPCVSPVLLLHSPGEKGVPKALLEKGEKCQKWQLRKAGSKWDRNRAIVHLVHAGILMQPYRLETSWGRCCNWTCIFSDHFCKGIPWSHWGQQELRLRMNKEPLSLGLSGHSSKSQEDATCVGEMQNQHLGHVLLQRGTMKLIF